MTRIPERFELGVNVEFRQRISSLNVNMDTNAWVLHRMGGEEIEPMVSCQLTNAMFQSYRVRIENDVESVTGLTNAQERAVNSMNYRRLWQSVSKLENGKRLYWEGERTSNRLGLVRCLRVWDDKSRRIDPERPVCPIEIESASQVSGIRYRWRFPEELETPAPEGVLTEGIAPNIGAAMSESIYNRQRYIENHEEKTKPVTRIPQPLKLGNTPGTCFFREDAGNTIQSIAWTMCLSDDGSQATPHTTIKYVTPFGQHRYEIQVGAEVEWAVDWQLARLQAIKSFNYKRLWDAVKDAGDGKEIYWQSEHPNDGYELSWGLRVKAANSNLGSWEEAVCPITINANRVQGTTEWTYDWSARLDNPFSVNEPQTQSGQTATLLQAQYDALCVREAHLESVANMDESTQAAAQVEPEVEEDNEGQEEIAAQVDTPLLLAEGTRVVSMCGLRWLRTDSTGEGEPVRYQLLGRGDVLQDFLPITVSNDVRPTRTLSDEERAHRVSWTIGGHHGVEFQSCGERLIGEVRIAINARAEHIEELYLRQKAALEGAYDNLRNFQPGRFGMIQNFNLSYDSPIKADSARELLESIASKPLRTSREMDLSSLIGKVGTFSVKTPFSVEDVARAAKLSPLLQQAIGLGGGSQAVLPAGTKVERIPFVDPKIEEDRDRLLLLMARGAAQFGHYFDSGSEGKWWNEVKLEVGLESPVCTIIEEGMEFRVMPHSIGFIIQRKRRTPVVTEGTSESGGHTSVVDQQEHLEYLACIYSSVDGEDGVPIPFRFQRANLAKSLLEHLLAGHMPDLGTSIRIEFVKEGN